MSDDEGWDSEAFARLFPDYDAMMAVLVEMIHVSKEAIVANGPDDLEPLAILGYDNGLGVIMVMADEVHPVEALSELLASSPLDDGKLGHARFLVLCVEAFASRGLDHVPARGELALRFASNDPHVTEMMSVNYVDHRGYRMMSLPFHYGDGGVIWDEHWDETTNADGEVTGYIPDVMLKAFEAWKIKSAAVANQAAN